MRFLCLHGVGSSNEVLEWQTAALRSELGSQHEFEFICGSHPFPQAQEIRDIFPQDLSYWAYTDPYRPETIIGFLTDLKEYIESEGPFDAILGFSQGAQLASTFLLHQQQENPYNISSSIKCAFFFCGLAPWRIEGKSVVRVMNNTNKGSISIPTAHFVGRKDEFYHESRELVGVCKAQNRVVLEHEGKHEIPRGRQVTSEMALIITGMIEKSLLLQ